MTSWTRLDLRTCLDSVRTFDLSRTHKVGSIHDAVLHRMGAVQSELQQLLLLLPPFTRVLLLLLGEEKSLKSQQRISLLHVLTLN